MRYFTLATALVMTVTGYAAEIPTFEQLDSELSKYKGHAKLEGL